MLAYVGQADLAFAVIALGFVSILLARQLQQVRLILKRQVQIAKSAQDFLGIDVRPDQKAPLIRQLTVLRIREFAISFTVIAVAIIGLVFFGNVADSFALIKLVAFVDACLLSVFFFLRGITALVLMARINE